MKYDRDDVRARVAYMISSSKNFKDDPAYAVQLFFEHLLKLPTIYNYKDVLEALIKLEHREASLSDNIRDEARALFAYIRPYRPIGMPKDETFIVPSADDCIIAIERYAATCFKHATVDPSLKKDAFEEDRQDDTNLKYLKHLEDELLNNGVHRLFLDNFERVVLATNGGKPLINPSLENNDLRLEPKMTLRESLEDVWRPNVDYVLQAQDRMIVMKIEIERLRAKLASNRR
jgi:hypothetical protein